MSSISNQFSVNVCVSVYTDDGVEFGVEFGVYIVFVCCHHYCLTHLWALMVPWFRPNWNC